MADTKISALTVTTAAGDQKTAVAVSGTSFAAYFSTVANVAGSNTQNEGVFFNNQGVTSSDTATLLYHYSTQALHLAAESSAIWLEHNPALNSTIPVSTLSFFSRQVSGRMFPKVVGPVGIEYILQPSIAQQSVWTWWPTSATASKSFGAGGEFNIGTFSSAAATVGNAYTTKIRATFRSSTGAANQTAGVGGSENQYFLSSTTGYGGFFFFARIGVDTYATSTRYLVGLTAAGSSAICTSNPTNHPNTLAFAIQDTVSVWSFVHCSTGVGTSEAISGQTGLASGLGYDFYIYSPSNTSRVWYRMDELNTGSTIIQSSVANHLPNTTSFMKPVAMCGQLNTSNGACRIGVMRLYCESDI